MSRFRMAVSYQGWYGLGVRPPLPAWLTPGRALTTYAQSVSFRYHTQLYWATPPWFDEEMYYQMQAMYESSASDEHVDHIVPLKHPLVCGLNVPWNLRVINDKKNLRKSNNYWPGCPFEQNEMFGSIDDIPDSAFRDFYASDPTPDRYQQLSLTPQFSQMVLNF